MQGVGFRPFVYRLANRLGLPGWVANTNEGLWVEVEGESGRLETFLNSIRDEAPSRSAIYSMEASWLDPAGYTGFEIRPSENSGTKRAFVLPDIVVCADCLAEIRDPHNRRFNYPFTNCTHCGPRFSILNRLPYDRANTTMSGFKMCAACREEYQSPEDRRFHAQPNGCPRCGPELALWNAAGQVVAARGDALDAVSKFLVQGHVVALKALGGFQLLAIAGDTEAVLKLRKSKHREAKPFALMSPCIERVRAICDVSEAEARLLTSPEGPIVLLCRRSSGTNRTVSPEVAPGNPRFGVMLPSTPLHHLLLAKVDSLLVATSGNLKDEPICIDELEALQRLNGIADFFLVHDRPIARPIDDSVAQVVLGREMVLRRARGYAPLPVTLSGRFVESPSKVTLSVGAHLKNTVALRIGADVYVSQHIGDLETVPAYAAFQAATRDLPSLYGVAPQSIVADMHPDYRSTQWALERGGPGSVVQRVQHHVAHVYSCMAENELAAPVLGVAWDGTGYGEDGTVWGGEFFQVTRQGCNRVATLRRFPLPGGDHAIQEPRRSALGLMFEAFGLDVLGRLPKTVRSAFERNELDNMVRMLEKHLNSPLTSSIGRLFDALCSLSGLRHNSLFEGQSAMELEFSIPPDHGGRCYSFSLERTSNARDSRPLLELDWQPMLEEAMADLERGVAPGLISAAFHNSLAQAVVRVALELGAGAVALSGGCFQNRYLLERTVNSLRAAGLRPYWPQRIPANDGGISLGQIVAACHPGV